MFAKHLLPVYIEGCSKHRKNYGKAHKMIDFTINKEVLRKNIREAKKHHIILPTIAQQKDPALVPQQLLEQLKKVGMQEFSPLNLFRITWKNEPVDFGGTYGKPNILELPHELTGVPARIRSARRR